MDLRWDRLNSGEQIAGGAALALLACMFFGWFNFGFVTENAWEALHFISPALTVVIAFTLAAVGIQAADKSLGDVPAGSVIFVLGCLAFILILFRLIDPISLPGGEGFEQSSSVEAGIFLALLAAAGIGGGGYLATGGAALEQLKRLVPQSGPMPPPPPAPPGRPTAPAPATPDSPTPPPPATAGLATPPPTAAVAPPPPPPPPPAVSVVGQNRFCEQCGAAIAEGDRFCSECGATQAPTPV